MLIIRLRPIHLFVQRVSGEQIFTSSRADISRPVYPSVTACILKFVAFTVVFHSTETRLGFIAKDSVISSELVSQVAILLPTVSRSLQVT